MKGLIALIIFHFSSCLLFGQWQQTSLNSGQFYSIVADDYKIFAAGYNLYSSDDGGLTWNTDLGHKSYYSLTMNGPNIFAGVAGGVWKSTDYGTTWVQAGLVNFNIYSMALKDTIVFAGTADKGALPVYKSVNNGASWINSGWGCPDGAVTSLYVNGDYIYAGYLDFGIYVNNINGGNWSAFNSGLPNTDYPYIGAITSIGNNVFAGTELGVYRSTDGEPWKAANNGLPTTFVRDFAKTGNTLFAGTDQGVFLSVDTGNTWVSFSEGLPGNMKIKSMAVQGTWLFAGAGSDGNGLWKCNIDTLVSIKKIPSAPNIYPNPGNGVVIIDNPGNFNSYEIFDIHGNRLASDSVDPQSFPLQLDFSFLPSGMYMIRFLGDKTSKTMKIVIQ